MKQQSPFYAEPADSLSSLQQAIPKRIAYRPAPGIPLHHRHSNPPGLNSLKALSPGLDRVEDAVDLQGGKVLITSSKVVNIYFTYVTLFNELLHSVLCWVFFIQILLHRVIFKCVRYYRQTVFLYLTYFINRKFDPLISLFAAKIQNKH